MICLTGKVFSGMSGMETKAALYLCLQESLYLNDTAVRYYHLDRTIETTGAKHDITTNNRCVHSQVPVYSNGHVKNRNVSPILKTNELE